MAETKKSSSSKSSSSSSSSSSKKSSIWGLNKISFYTIAAVAILYLISLILSACGVSSVAVMAMQNIGTAIMVGITAYLAWKYVRPKQTVWKVLYFVLLLVILAGIIVPLVMG